MNTGDQVHSWSFFGFGLHKLRNADCLSNLLVNVNSSRITNVFTQISWFDAHAS